MSLLTFLQKPDIRKGFREAITKPSFKVNKPMLAPPLTQNYRMIGRAFDYLMRFYIERLNPKSNTKPWVAEGAPLFLSRNNDGKLEVIRNYLSEARKLHKTYIEEGKLSDELISCTLRLAYLDSVYRTGELEFEALTNLSDKDIEDLKNLYSIIDGNNFKAKLACYLNPSFGYASRIVNNADADLIIDNKLIDIKTTKNLELKLEDVHQLVGYYILVLLGGIDCRVDFRKTNHLNYVEEVSEITELCIYFSRHGFLYSMPISELISPESMLTLTKWFIKSACPQRKLRQYCENLYGQAPKDILKELV